MASSDSSGRRANPALYGGMPPASGPAGMAPRLLEFADELRREGVAVGTSELLDAIHALDAVSWTSREDFHESLAATLAKSQEDRHVLDVLFDRFFFRVVEREAVARGLTETRFRGAADLDLDALRERIREAIRAGSDGEMRDLASVDTGNARRDAHLRSARYLAVETYPRMTYRSTGLRRAGQGFLVHGELSVHGVTRPVVLALKLHKFIRDQYGQLRARLSAVATIDRRVLGISFGVPMDAAGVFIGRRVQVAIEVEALPALDRRSGRGDQRRHFVRPESR